MKKQYISPNIKIAAIELAALMVNSPDPSTIPVVPETGVPPGQAESKRHGLIILDDEEFLLEELGEE